MTKENVIWNDIYSTKSSVETMGYLTLLYTSTVLPVPSGASRPNGSCDPSGCTAGACHAPSGANTAQCKRPANPATPTWSWCPGARRGERYGYMRIKHDHKTSKWRFCYFAYYLLFFGTSYLNGHQSRWWSTCAWNPFSLVIWNVTKPQNNTSTRIIPSYSLANMLYWNALSFVKCQPVAVASHRLLGRIRTKASTPSQSPA